MAFNGRLLMAYRYGEPGSRIAIAVLDPDSYAVLDNIPLNLRHPIEATHGVDDPQLFVHAGRPHVGFIGVKGPLGPCSQLYARLDDDSLDVEEVFYPHYEHRPAWEKNWGFFSPGGELYAVHSIGPAHVIYRIDGNSAYPVYGQANPLPWSGGHRRGGAAPVLVEDRYYSWFHGSEWQADKATGASTLIYNVGVYTFEPFAPFRPIQQVSKPLVWADCKTKPLTANRSVIFPRGAVLRGDRWLVSVGVHDRHCDILEFSREEVDEALRRG